MIEAILSSQILDATTAGRNFVKLPNPGSISWPRINADNSISALSDSDTRIALGLGTLATQSGNITDYVPYTGATGAVNLGSQSLTAGAITASGAIVSPTSIGDSATISGMTGIDLTTANCLLFRQGGTRWLGLQSIGAVFANAGGIGFAANGSSTSFTTSLYEDSAGILALRNSTNAQTFNIANTYTSSTSFEYGRFQWSSNQFRIGTAVGSAGGTQRNLVLGTWDSAGTWTERAAINTSAVLSVGNGTTPTGGSFKLFYGYALNPTWCLDITSDNIDKVRLNSASGANAAIIFQANGTESFRSNTVGIILASNRIITSTDGSSLTIGGNSHWSTVSTNLLGMGRSGTGTGGSVNVIGGSANGTDQAGGMTLVAGGRGTGAGLGGAIVFQTAPGGTTGTSLNTLTTRLTMDSTGNCTFAPGASSSGSQTGFTFTAPAPTGQTASTEATMVNWNLASTVTWAAGALTTQRAFRIQAPTYAFASASTITSAATLSISGAPVAGTNATLTNSYALWVENGMSQFSGIINTAAAVIINAGSQAFNTSFHFLSWNGGFLGWSSSGTVNSTSSLDTAFRRVSAGLIEINNGTAETYRDLILRNLTTTGTATIGAYTLPATDGTNGQVLKTNGSGTVTWQNDNAGTGGVSASFAIAMAVAL